jgi:hypothetical protein
MLLMYFYYINQIKFSSIILPFIINNYKNLKLQQNFTPILTTNCGIIFLNDFIFLHSFQIFIPNNFLSFVLNILEKNNNKDKNPKNIY